MEDQPNLDPEFLLRPKDVLEQTGITHQILYRYITLGLIEPALTTKTGLRLFHPNVVLLIRVIQSITRNGGYSLRDLKDIFFKDERVRKLTAK
ncbi:MAG TPA: MerR family transcriptional regulator [Planctomycetota bacterium]|nr:MerR family transcriptional regulator [Planctomycetota bacterium]